MITLDSNTYSIHLTAYRHQQNKFANTLRSNTGVPIRIESGAFENRYTMTLICNTTDIANLRTSYAKVDSTTNRLGFTDEEGMNWVPTAGTDDSTHTYNTGVYFEAPINPQPLAVRGGWASNNRFTVEVVLVVAGDGMTSNNLTILQDANGVILRA